MSSQELQDLSAVEERLRREREECEKLEAQIRALSTMTTAPAPAPAAPAAAPAAPARAAPPVPAPVAPPSPPATASVFTEAAGTSFSTALESVVAASAARKAASTGRAASVASRKSAAAAKPAPVAAPSARSRSPLRGESAVLASSGMRYRSPIYRSASPSRRVKGGVVMSSFDRAPRFVDQKTDIPGPGTYRTPDIFAPQLLGAGVDLDPSHRRVDPSLGAHTHHDVAVAKGTRATQLAEHHQAMLAATARVAATTPSSEDGNDGEGAASMARAVKVLVTAAGGDAGAALETSLRRERALRKEVHALQKSLAAAKASASQANAMARNEIDGLVARLTKRSATLDAAAGKTKAAKDAFSQAEEVFVQVQRAVNELGSALAAAEVARATPDAPLTLAALERGLGLATDRFPPLSALIEAARALDDHLQFVGQALTSAASSVGSSGAVSNAMNLPSAPGPASRAAAAAAAAASASSGFLAYSAMSAALAAPHTMGNLGSSAGVVDEVVREKERRRALADGSARPAGPDGGSAASRGRSASVSTTATESTAGGSPANAPTTAATLSAAANEAAKAKAAGGKAAGAGISAAQVAAFARKARHVSDVLESETNAAAAAAAAAAKGYVTGPRGSLSPPPTRGGVVPPHSGRGDAASVAGSSVISGSQGGSAASSSAAGYRRATLSSTTPVLRRGGLGSPGAGEAPSAASAASASSTKETTVADTLAHIFKYYSLFGDRDSDGSGLRSAQFLKAVREAGLLSDGRMTNVDVDLAFTRALTRTGVKVKIGSRLGFEEFIGALNELAIRRYRGAEAVAALAADDAAAAAAADPDAFRQLLQEAILPLYGRLKTDPMFIADVLQEGAAAAAAAFADEFLRPEVAAFFSEHEAFLQGVFASYSYRDRRADGSLPQGVSEASAAARLTMSRRALIQWAHDYKVVPEMVSRPELLAIAKEAQRAAGKPEGADDLSYYEWVEVLALLGYNLSASESPAFGLGRIVGPHEGASLPMRTKVELLFYNMHEHGAKFGTPDGMRLIRAVTAAVREQAAATEAQAAAAARASTAPKAAQVAHVLAEGVAV